MGRYKLVIFDMDGTVLNTLTDIVNAVNYTLKTFGYETLSCDQIRHCLGNGSRWIFEQIFGVDRDDIIDKLLNFYSTYYESHCNISTKPYEGIVELMKALHQQKIKIAIVSNKPDFAVQPLCGQHFPCLIDFACGEKEGVRRKPFPDSTLEVLNRLQIEKERTLYVGDSEVDIATAHNAGLDCVAVTWGFRTQKELTECGAKILVDTVEELEEHILLSKCL